MNNNIKQWNTVIYARLSKDDGDKIESDSITNQKDLIYDFSKNHEDINICSVRVDDGYSGVDFNRPAFSEMINDIRDGVINCIVVKDLSRFGRNWIETGRYIEKIFPALGVRFISISENLDTNNARTSSDSLVIPMKNLINDAYLSDISVKVRSQLEVKRKKGDFIGSFCMFGYKKDCENHNKLVIDDASACVVRDIFKWKIEGLSQQRIADKLNELGVSSPMEYKQENGVKFASSFKTKSKALWSVKAINRILTNEIYIGNLEQGKRSKINYKVKSVVKKAKEDWIKVENTHDNIVSKADFILANELLKRDTRTSPDENSLFLFSGLIVCGDCGQSMIRKTVLSKGKKYFYYVCSGNKYLKTCSSHSINENSLEKSIFYSLKSYIKSIVSMESMNDIIEEMPYKKQDIEKYNKVLILKESEVLKNEERRFSLYEDFKNKIISKEEYLLYKTNYENSYTELIQDCIKIKGEIEQVLNFSANKKELIQYFKAYINVEELNRKTVVSLIERITIFEKKQIELRFRYSYNFESIIEENKEVRING